MKKLFVKTAVVVTGLLAATAFFPDQVNQVLGGAGEVADKWLARIVLKIPPHILSEPLLKKAMTYVPIISVFLIVAGVAVFKLKKKEKRKTPVAAARKPVKKKEENDEDVLEEQADAGKGGEYNQEIVVRFFLKIFKIQLGALKSAPGKFQPVTDVNVWPNTVYELSVFHDAEWISRRLTIGPLGDDGVSKSVCYYVIYDEHLVVKIPPEPIADFKEYLTCIKADMKIARKLAPKECIIPRVSVILGRLISDGKDDDDTNRVEKGYVERLSTNSQFQEYLKIGDSFVFFMDLSRYYFLSTVLHEMHDLENKLPKEILTHSDIIWDTYEFEGRYGRENAHLGFEMRNIYDEYEREINRLLIQYGYSSSLPAFTMKNWFLIHLSGRGRIEVEGGEYSEAFIEDLNSLSRESMIDNRVSIEAYRKIVRTYINKTSITKYKAEMGSIVTNLIGLLIWLEQKQVALRDLKPDNLLIAGDPGKYPQFLRAADRFSMGIIDVETAVDYGAESFEDIKQPQLGGTPKYATPSHLFPNELIIAMYGDLKRILHLQDWYAAVAMIFRVVTGGTMFEKTATLLPEIKRILESPVTDGEQLSSITEYVSRMFWRSSVDEFYEKIDKNRVVLSSVRVVVLERDKKFLAHEVLKEKNTLAKVILERINNQSLFKSKKNKEQLFYATVKSITSMREKWGKRNPQDSGNDRSVVAFLKELEQLKIQFEQRAMAIEYLKSSRTEIPVATIMEVMFNIVLTAMYTEAWGELQDDEVDGYGDADDSASYEATI